MATSNSSPDPASALLSLNRNQTVPATAVQTGQPATVQGGSTQGGITGGYSPGSAPGVGPASVENPAGAQAPPAGAVGNLANVSPGAPTGSGAPGTTAGGLQGTGLAGSAATQNYAITTPSGIANITDAPNGGQNGVTPSNAWELVSRTS